MFQGLYCAKIYIFFLSRVVIVLKCFHRFDWKQLNWDPLVLAWFWFAPDQLLHQTVSGIVHWRWPSWIRIIMNWTATASLLPQGVPLASTRSIGVVTSTKRVTRSHLFSMFQNNLNSIATAIIDLARRWSSFHYSTIQGSMGKGW